jgi:DNA-binding MarR family transcriptional regulator
LVEKEQSATDGRVWVVKLSKKGRGKVPQIRKIYGDLGRRSFAKLGTEDRTRLADILGRLVADDG